MFLENLAIAAKQVGILYILVAVGFICDKTGLFKEKTARLSNDLLFYIITPAVIVTAFMSMDNTPENYKKLLLAFVFAAAIQIVGALIALPFFRDKSKKDNCIYKFASNYGNVGYMALPLANAVLGAEGVFYCSVVVMVFNISSFTHGIMVMTGEKKFNPKKLILNPGTIAVFIGLPLFIFGVSLPEIIQTPVDYLASLNTPLAMIFFGTYLANTDLKTMFSDKRIYLTAFLKLIVLPLCMLGLFRIFGITGALVPALILSSSAPSANNTVMFAAKYDKDAPCASKVVAMVSFISIITMPVMIALGQQVA